MSNQPPPFQVPDDNEPPAPDPQFGPPAGEPQGFTPPYGSPQQSYGPPPQAPQQPAPGQWAPPPAQPQQQWAPPAAPGQPQPQPQNQWAPPPAPPTPQPSQGWAPPPPAQPGPSDQSPYGPPPQVPQQQFGAPQFAPPADAGPGSAPPYVPAQPGQPQWSSGFVDTPAPHGGGAAGVAGAGAGGAAGAQGFAGGLDMPPPMAPQPADTGYSSGPGSGAYPSGTYSSGPGHPQQGPYQPAPGYATSERLRGRAIQLGPPRTPRPYKRKRSLLIPVAVVSLAITAWAAPGAVREYRHDRTDGLGEAQAKGDVQWSLKDGRDGPEPDTNGNTSAQPGAWFTGDDLVVTEQSRVVAYDRETGRTEWEYQAPDGTVVCASAAQDGDGPALVGFGDKEACGSLQAIDLAKGTKLWSAQVPANEDDLSLSPGGSGRIAVSGGVAVLDGKAFGVADGRPLWDAKSALAGCRNPEYFGGAALVARATCGSATGIIRVDPRTGRQQWRYDIQGEAGASALARSVDVVSTSPVAVLQSPPRAALSQEPPVLTVLDDQGKEDFKATENYPMASSKSGGLGSSLAALPVLAGDNVVYVMGSDRSSKAVGFDVSGVQGANLVTAYDRGSGRALWTVKVDTGFGFGKVASLAGAAYPIRVEESGDLLLLATGGSNFSTKPMQLVRVSAADGTFTNLKEFPGKVSINASGMSDVRIFEHDGAVFFVGSPEMVLGDDTQGRLPPSVKDASAELAHYRVIALK